MLSSAKQLLSCNIRFRHAPAPFRLLPGTCDTYRLGSSFKCRPIFFCVFEEQRTVLVARHIGARVSVCSFYLCFRYVCLSTLCSPLCACMRMGLPCAQMVHMRACVTDYLAGRDKSNNDDWPTRLITFRGEILTRDWSCGGGEGGRW